MKYFSISMMFVFALVAVSSVMAQDAQPAADTPAAVAPAAAPTAVATPAMPPPLELRKTGVVSVTKDASGKVSAIKLIVTSYDIILDEGSKALEGMDGQRVRVTGTFSMQQDGKRCFTVKGVEPITDEIKASGAPAAAPAAPAAAKPAPAAAPEK